MSSVEVKKRPNEPIGSLLRRFKDRLKRARAIEQVKKSRFREKPLTKREEKVRALRKVGVRRKEDYLRRIGKLEERQ